MGFRAEDWPCGLCIGICIGINISLSYCHAVASLPLPLPSALVLSLALALALASSSPSTKWMTPGDLAHQIGQPRYLQGLSDHSGGLLTQKVLDSNF
jgi:hypothetical protein